MQKLVAFFVFPDLQILDLVGPLQAFATANEAVQELEHGPPPYRTQVVSRCGGSITSSAGLTVGTIGLSAVDEPVHTLVIAGGSGVHAEAESVQTLAWIRSQAVAVTRLCSVCTGSFLLAAAGALDGKRATTHWSSAQRLKREHPAVLVDAEPIFTHDGGVWTSAGVTAGIDLALALIQQDCGARVAMEVAKRLVVFIKRPAGQSQFSGVLQLQAREGCRFDELHAWIGENLRADLRVEALAASVAMSPRSFSRHYREATGLSPAKAVERIRVEAARCLLETSNLSMKSIAGGCGFGDDERLRRAFTRVLRTSPARYRALFGLAGVGHSDELGTKRGESVLSAA